MASEIVPWMIHGDQHMCASQTTPSGSFWVVRRLPSVSSYPVEGLLHVQVWHRDFMRFVNLHQHLA